MNNISLIFVGGILTIFLGETCLRLSPGAYSAPWSIGTGGWRTCLPSPGAYSAPWSIGTEGWRTCLPSPGVYSAPWSIGTEGWRTSLLVLTPSLKEQGPGENVPHFIPRTQTILLLVSSWSTGYSRYTNIILVSESVLQADCYVG